MCILGGVDIGGTKCAVCLGEIKGEQIHLLEKYRFSTRDTPEATLREIVNQFDCLLETTDARSRLRAIGISCGGPLDSRRGIVLSPPNLPGWDHVDVVHPFGSRYQVPTGLQNDANACALAEWKWGAGRGTQNMIFLTFGTGMGAGLILNGRLYSGTNDLAGEVGHIRMERMGPVGYGKQGSLEGFCSGGGIANLAQMMCLEQIHLGKPASFCRSFAELHTITAEVVGKAAQAGDPLALQVFELVGQELGRGLALLVDLLNPEKIVIGSIYNRQRALLEPLALRVLAEEALPQALAVCQVVPAALGENVGDLASLSVALNLLA
ncbi:MAG TPA: ROK family protein [Anaerolineaceae bacterium]